MISDSRSNSWQNIEIGQLRSRVSIQAPGGTQDAGGQPLQTWTTVYQCWARIGDATARELANADLVSSQVTHSVTIRWPGATPLLSPGMRVQYVGVAGTQTYIVQAIQNPEQRNILLKLLCLAINVSE